MKEWLPPTMEHGRLTRWWWLPYYPQNIKIGNNVDIGAFTCLFGHEGIEIGDNVQIGSHCSLYSLNTEEMKKSPERQNPNLIRGKIQIKKNAVIGSHCIIFPNVVIEEKEEIRAKSIVFIDKKGRRCIF